MKKIIAEAIDNGMWKNARFEHALFNSLWGQEENLAAILQPKK